MDGYNKSVKLFKPGEKGIHHYVDTYERWGLVVCFKCGKKVDIADPRSKQPDDKCPDTIAMNS